MQLKVFTAFSGYDSQCMALDRLGVDYDLVGWSEIDKYAIQAHNAVYPQYRDRNFGDICHIDWAKVPDFDLFTYSFPCTDISTAGKQAGLEKGEHVGRNQETGRKIVEMLRHYGIQVMEQSPLRKCWQGKDGKITHEELKRLCQMSGIEFNRPRSNQEERDSALLAITCSGLPIKYKVVESKINK